MKALVLMARWAVLVLRTCTGSLALVLGLVPALLFLLTALLKDLDTALEEHSA